MKKEYLQNSIVVDAGAAAAFHAINRVNEWWSETLEGASGSVGDEFIYRYKGKHYSKMKVVELIPDQRVVWDVLDSELTFLSHQNEWDGTKVQFEIIDEGAQTRIEFTHIGLNAESECFDVCTKGWNHYLHNSLKPLIETGVGKPNLAIEG